MIFGFTLYQIAAYFLIYSFLGWGLEVAYAAVTTGELVNRGFLNGPVCPIYGFGMLTMLFFLTPLLNNNLLLFIGGIIIPSAIELAGGWLLYKIYHTRWWDYTDRPFNLGGYICLEFSLYWGLGAVFMMKLVHPTIAALVGMVPTTAGWIILALLYILYGVDLVVTTITATGLAEELEALERIADGIHDISDVMEDMVRTELELLQKPVAYMQKEDKLALVQRMENKGIFDVKGAVEYVAERLGVTNYTIYNYLKAIRSAKR